jgi:hypothetical protein
MANYLQRIADSGARTSSIAKPPAAARGLMPPVGPLRGSSLGEEAPPMENPPDPLIPGRAALADSPESTAHVEPVRESVRGDKPDPGKTAPPPAAIPQRIAPQNATPRTSVRAPEALRASATSTPRERSVHKVAQETIRTFAPRALANRTVHDQPVQPQSEAAKVQFRRPNSVPSVERDAEQKPMISADKARTSLATERVRMKERPAMIHSAQVVDEPGQMNKKASTQTSLEARLAGNEKKDSGRAKPVSAHIEAQAELPMGRESLRETPWLQVASTAPGRSVRPPALAESRRGTQISIGRIDVEVNNQAPPQAATQQTARRPARMNSLEQRYLGRFLFSR